MTGADGHREPTNTVRIVADTLRTRRHAEMLFDAVVNALGDHGWLQTEGNGKIRRLFRRDPRDAGWIVPWPLLELNTGGRFGVASASIRLQGTPTPPPRAEPPSKLRGLGPGEIRLRDGAEHVGVVYDDGGGLVETRTSVHARPLAGLLPPQEDRSEHPVELLARFLVSLDGGRHGPGRVHLPVAVPPGVDGVWHRGLGALRGALFEDRAPRGARWAVADGLTGTAVGFGATQEEALEQWRAAVAARSPWPAPEAPAEPLPELPDGAMMLSGPRPDAPWPEALPEHVPAALVPLAQAPGEPPPFGMWTTLVGAHGATGFAARRRKRQGFTLIGQHAVDGLDLDRLGAQMDEEERRLEQRFQGTVAATPGGPCRTSVFRVDRHRQLTLEAASETCEWHAGDLDADVLGRCVVRQRWVE